MQRTERGALFGLRRDKDPAFPFFRPFGCRPGRFCLGARGHHAQAIRDQAERSEDAVALLLRALRDHERHLGSHDTAVDLFIVRHPLHEVLGRWPVGQEVRENLLRRLDKELAFAVLRGLKKGLCDGFRLGLSPQFLGWSPVRTAQIERIQNHVAAFWVVEPLDEFAGGVVNDCGVSTSLYLAEHLKDDGGLPRTRVANDLDMLRFGPGRNAQHLLETIDLDANAIAPECAIELFGR